mgnify:CR=1 FL=1
MFSNNITNKFGKSKVIHNNLIQVDLEDLSCLTRAYNFANFIEAYSPGGAYSWTTEEWTGVFQAYFDRCEEPTDEIRI